MADESELSRFRQQWKAEVTARAQGKAEPSSSTELVDNSRSSTRPKRPSFTHAPTAPRPHATADEDAEVLSGAIEHPLDRQDLHPYGHAIRRSSVTGEPVGALEHYERAVQREAEGKMGESLKLYRQAFRLDDNVDKIYKEKHFPRMTSAKGKERAPSTAKEGSKEPLPGHTNITGLVCSFAGLRIEPAPDPSITSGVELSETEDKAAKKFSLLAAIPSEILLQVLSYVACTDISAYARLTQVCKALCYVVVSEERIWGEATRLAFSRMSWDWSCTVGGHPIIHTTLSSEPTLDEDEDDSGVDEGSRPVPLDEEELSNYNNSYREMFRLRPRIRFNGIYISTCNYHRSGGHSGTSLTWDTPVHIVTYYRYLRFYPDGTVLSLLTTHEPTDVVYSFSTDHLTPAHLGGLAAGGSALSSWAEHVSRGRWRIDPAGRVDIELVVPNMSRYLFRMQLRVGVARSGGIKRGSVKLNWEGFWSWNKLTDDLAAFEGRNDKPFWFSRVGAFVKV